MNSKTKKEIINIARMIYDNTTHKRKNIKNGMHNQKQIQYISNNLMLRSFSHIHKQIYPSI